MARRPLLLGIDVGTSGCKCLLIDDTGAVVAARTHEYPLSMPRPLWSEQDPEDWWQAAKRGVADVLTATDSPGSRIAAIGLTGQMHGLVLLDGAGRVLRPAMLWNDQRTAPQCAEITRTVGAQRVIELTGNPVLTGFTAPKLLWVRQNEPEAFARASRVLLPKDYVRYRLTGEFATDVADASGTSLFDVGRRRWSDEMLAGLDVPFDWLPRVNESPVVCARVSPAAANETGLAAGTPVVAGAGDQAAGAIGAGIVREGTVSVTIGTSGVAFAASGSFRTDPQGRLHAFCHAVPGAWHLMSVMLSAGGSFEWWCGVVGSASAALGHRERGGRRTSESVRDDVSGGVADALLALAADAPPGCDGLTFLPYLTGERTPHADPWARGVFFGLTPRHGPGHMTRAVLEGVCFGLRDGLALMRGLGVAAGGALEGGSVAAGGEPSGSALVLRVIGGGARSALWRQVLADVCRADVATVNVAEGAAFGAALLAGVGADVWSDVTSAADALVRVTGVVGPTADAAGYEAGYARFRSLYPALAGAFRAAGARADD